MNIVRLKNIEFLSKVSSLMNNQDNYATSFPLYVLMKKTVINGIDKSIHKHSELRYSEFNTFSGQFDDIEKNISKDELEKLNPEPISNFDDDFNETPSKTSFYTNNRTKVYKEFYQITKSGRCGIFVDVFLTESACKKAMERKHNDCSYYMYVTSAYDNPEIKSIQSTIKDSILIAELEKKHLVNNAANKTIKI